MLRRATGAIPALEPDSACSTTNQQAGALCRPAARDALHLVGNIGQHEGRCPTDPIGQEGSPQLVHGDNGWKGPLYLAKKASSFSGGSSVMATTGTPLSRSNATTSGKDALQGAHQVAQKRASMARRG